MKSIQDIKNGLKELVPQGIDLTFQAIKAAIAEGTDKYNELLLIEGRYQDVSRQLLQGLIGNDAAQISYNKVRSDLLTYIDSLQEAHLKQSQTSGAGSKPDIYNGEVFYRIPATMKIQEEVKCLVRLAFDKKILMEGLTEEAGDVLKDIRISEVMGVELLDPMDDAFEIRTLNDTVQFVEKDLHTEWVFYVKPIAEGIHPLVLKISVIEIKNGVERKRNVVLEEKVDIVSTMPAEMPATIEFSKAEIDLNMTKSEGSDAMPHAPPAPKSADVSPVAPGPVVNPGPVSPQPVVQPAPSQQKSSRSFRKIAPALSAFLIVVVAGWAFLFNNGGGGETRDNPNPGPPVMSSESEEWKKMEGTATLEEYESFVKRYPNGIFTEKAKMKIDSILTIGK